MVQPLNEPAIEILEMYKYDTSDMKISYQPYLRQVREIFDIIRGKKPKLKYGHYTTHSGRDTYISICVQKGVNMKNILDWVGHSSYQIMDRYIKQKVRNIISLIKEFKTIGEILEFAG